MKGDGKSRMVLWLGVAWLGIALLMLLAPSPREWGEFGRQLSPYYDRIEAVFQPAVHLVLMAILAVALMHHFESRSAVTAVLISFVLVMVLAIVLEGLQGLLPAEFSRRCDVEDLVPGAGGAVIGCCIGLLVRIIKSGDFTS